MSDRFNVVFFAGYLCGWLGAIAAPYAGRALKRFAERMAWLMGW